MDQATIDAVGKTAAAHGLRIIISEPIILLQLVAQEGNGPTIRVDPQNVEAQIAAEIHRLREWLSAHPQPAEAAKQDAISQQQTPRTPPAPCGGCQTNMFKKAMGVFNTGVNLVKFVGEMAVGIKATQEQHDDRKATCEGCQAVDAAGDKMYREHKDSHSCGQPRLDNMLRDESVDGCGCWLELKWWGKDEKCPLGKWKN